MPHDELALIDAWKGGDRSAGDVLLRRHLPALQRFFANKVGEERDDLVQRSILACLKSKDGFEGRSSFRTFLFTVAKRQLYRHYERRGSDLPAQWPEQSSVDALSDTPSQLVARHEQQRLLLAALRRLPLQLQVAVELHYFEDLATHELAAVLDIPQGTVKSRLRRAREGLQIQLQRLAETRLAEETIASLQEWMQRIRAEMP